MMVDTDEYVASAEPEKDQVAIINPDNLEVDEDSLDSRPLATDHEAMKELVLPPLLEEPKTLEDVVNTWNIESWRSMSKKEHGPVFQAGGSPWRILLFPHGNNVEQCSIYLEHGFQGAAAMPENWSCCVQFALVLWNPNDARIYWHHTAHHRFTKEEGDWGFTRFLELRKMFNVVWEGRDRPMCENDKANISAYIRVVEDETGVLWHNFNSYDSKKETGFVGLKNQGATCYLNSLLQSLYFTNAFRKAIYEIPTQQDESMANSAYTLQRLFYQLQTCDNAVSTHELTKSFGWETRHIFEQQDVQELSRKLMERMEERMKGTKSEKALAKMFSGKIKTYISCINVDYESSRIEDFWDIQLNVSGNKNLQESFSDYIQVEKMEGENQYLAGDQYKLQDANKGVIFTSFPDVLHLQLKRFEYDIHLDTMTKINARYEFPESFDASPYLSGDAEMSEPWDYQLHGVLVHNGDLNAGHYYAFLKPNKDGWFYRYDDDKVTKATMREVLEDNFGGEYRTPGGHLRSQAQKKAPIMRSNSAYMLVYIRKSRLDQILHPVSQDDIPSHLQQRFQEEIAIREAKKKEKEEAHLFIWVKALTEQTFRSHAGTDLGYFDAAQDSGPAAPRQYRVMREMPMHALVGEIARDAGTDPKRMRLWLMVNRQNKTVRPDVPIMDLRPTVEDTHQRAAAFRDPSLRVWAEVAEEVNDKGEAVWPTYQSQINGMVVRNDLILLFLKCFDVEAQTIHGAGHVYISKEKKVEDLVPAILKRMDWGDSLPSDEKILMWEEIKPNMIEAMKGKQTLKAAELQDGDIICFQRCHKEKSSLERRLGRGDGKADEPRSSDRFEDAREYYDFLFNKKFIKFHAHPGKCKPDKYPQFDLVLSSKISYDGLAERVGARLGVQPTHIRFWTVHAASGNPKVPVKRSANPQTLGLILNPGNYNGLTSNQRADCLYFEVLEMSLAELDSNKSIKITWLSEGITKETQLELLVPKAGTIEDLIQVLLRKAQLPSEAEAGKIRVWEASGNRFYREVAREFSVVNINDFTVVYAERIPEDERDADELAYIQVFHFQGEPSRAHGVPFKFKLIADEKFSDTKKRLERRTGLKGKLFEKVRFAVVRRQHFSKPSYLGDDDILWNAATSDDDALGLDHVDRSRNMRNGGTDLFLR